MHVHSKIRRPPASPSGLPPAWACAPPPPPPPPPCHPRRQAAPGEPSSPRLPPFATQPPMPPTHLGGEANHGMPLPPSCLQGDMADAQRAAARPAAITSLPDELLTKILGLLNFKERCAGCRPLRHLTDISTQACPGIQAGVQRMAAPGSANLPSWRPSAGCVPQRCAGALTTWPAARCC